MLIKVCGLTRPENISKIVDLNPDFAGLIFVPHSKRYLNPTLPFELPQFDPAEKKTKFTGVFANSTKEIIISTVKRWKLSAVQLHAEESNEFCSALKEGLPNLILFKTVQVGDYIP